MYWPASLRHTLDIICPTVKEEVVVVVWSRRREGPMAYISPGQARPVQTSDLISQAHAIPRTAMHATRLEMTLALRQLGADRVPATCLLRVLDDYATKQRHGP